MGQESLIFTLFYSLADEGIPSGYTASASYQEETDRNIFTISNPQKRNIFSLELESYLEEFSLRFSESQSKESIIALADYDIIRQACYAIITDYVKKPQDCVNVVFPVLLPKKSPTYNVIKMPELYLNTIVGEFRCYYCVNIDGKCLSYLPTEILKSIGCSKEDFHKSVLENTMKSFPILAVHLNQAFAQNFGKEHHIEEKLASLYQVAISGNNIVPSNAGILSKEFLDYIYNLTEGKYYLIFPNDNYVLAVKTKYPCNNVFMQLLDALDPNVICPITDTVYVYNGKKLRKSKYRISFDPLI